MKIELNEIELNYYNSDLLVTKKALERKCKKCTFIEKILQRLKSIFSNRGKA